MVATSIKPVGRTADGKQIVSAVLVADSPPEILPTTGEGIKGMSANQVFAPFSILYVTGEADAKVYIAGEDGAFKAQ